MRILIIGATGTIGKHIASSLSEQHEVITAGRNSGDYHVDINSKISIESLFRKIGKVDACICAASCEARDNFSTLTELDLFLNMKGKLFGQVNTVLVGQHYLNDNGSFTLTSGIYADTPAKGLTGGGMIGGALHSFVRSASIELPRGIRVNAISPGMLHSTEDILSVLPGCKPVDMQTLTAAYKKSVEDLINGQIIRVYE